jgi:DNA-binding NarL/FixJ family response regulator
MMISEGAANKHIAHSLGLSEATVKFHLGNVYRKLGCRNRQEAISSARALGIVR